MASEKTKIKTGKGPKINAVQMMILANVGNFFTNCASFPYLYDQPVEMQTSIENIKSGLEGNHKQEVTDIKNKMEEIMDIINKLKQ